MGGIISWKLPLPAVVMSSSNSNTICVIYCCGALCFFYSCLLSLLSTHPFPGLCICPISSFQEFCISIYLTLQILPSVHQVSFFTVATLSIHKQILSDIFTKVILQKSAHALGPLLLPINLLGTPVIVLSFLLFPSQSLHAENKDTELLVGVWRGAE